MLTSELLILAENEHPIEGNRKRTLLAQRNILQRLARENLSQFAIVRPSRTSILEIRTILGSCKLDWWQLRMTWMKGMNVVSLEEMTTQSTPGQEKTDRLGSRIYIEEFGPQVKQAINSQTEDYEPARLLCADDTITAILYEAALHWISYSNGQYRLFKCTSANLNPPNKIKDLLDGKIHFSSAQNLGKGRPGRFLTEWLIYQKVAKLLKGGSEVALSLGGIKASDN